ncbi:MAG: DUF4870 domain-containing protein [Planctomycetota bacterium]
MIADELEKLIRLRNSGDLSEEEFAIAKQRILGISPVGSEGSFSNLFGQPVADRVCGLDSRLYIALMHGLQLISFTGIGILAPIVMWVIGRDESAEVDRHGRIIVNWLISGMIYLVISTLLAFVVIGVPMLVILGGLFIIFPVVGTLKALDGKVWKYPLSIEFFAVEMPSSF